MNTRDYSKTVFFITPLGSEASEDRLRFEKVCRSILTPVLKSTDFHLISALDFPLQTQINQEVINSVENSAMCVADVTGSNPNVMYELGIRRQTGRPYITIKEKGDPVPFDIIVEKYQEYDLTDVDSVINAQEQISSFVAGLRNEENFVPSASVPAIFDQVMSIEAKIDRLLRSRSAETSSKRNRPNSNASSTVVGSLADRFRSPQSAFQDALLKNDIDGACAAMVRWSEASEPTATMLYGLGVIARTRAPEIGAILSNFEDWQPKDNDERKAFIVSLNSMSDEFLNSTAGQKLVQKATSFFDNDEFKNPEEAASAANQLGMFFWDRERHEESLRWSEIAAENNPDVPAYHYNTSLSVYHLDGAAGALPYAEMAVKLGRASQSPDEAHLDHLVDIYHELNEPEKASQANDELREVSPIRAELNSSKYGI